MNTVRMGVLLAALLTASPSGMAQTGNDLHRWCRTVVQNTNSEFATFGRCIGYLEGGRQGLEFATYLSLQAKTIAHPTYCVPDGVTNGQVARVFVQYLEAHPSRLHEPALGLYLEALIEAFPCRR